MNTSVMQWAIRNGVSHQALAELRELLGLDRTLQFLYSDHRGGEAEAGVQARVRLEAARKGVKLWRNNVGVLVNEKTGQPVRYGLANDSKQLNAAVKSADLIGWRPVVITPSHVGSTIAQFVSRECKRVGWNYTGDAHELAQLRWAEVITADGGDAKFCTGEGSL